MRDRIRLFPLLKRALAPTVALSLAASLGVSIAGAQTAATGAAPSPQPRQCFFMQDWKGWKASQDSRILYLRTGVSQVYRLDLSYACPDLHNIDARIINRVRGGSNSVCDAMDLDLTVYTPPGVSSPCLVKSITQLTPDQAAALAPQEKP
jgi:hypothetical protein